MLDPFVVWLELLFVNLGMALNRLSAQQQRMITLFLASLLMVAATTRLLLAAVAR